MNKLIAKFAHEKSWLCDLIFISALAGLFYLLYLGSYPLFTPDEGRYSEVAREMLATGDYITPRVNGVTFLDKPILYYWLQVAAIYLFGIKEWALRLFPSLFGLGGIVLSYISGRHFYDRRTGIIAAVILATSPLYFIAAHYANLDLEVAVLLSGALLCFLIALRKPTNYLPILFIAYLFGSLAFLTKGMIGIALPAIITGSWILIQFKFNLIKKLHLHYGIIIFLAVCGPWYYLVQRANPDFFNYFFILQQVSRFMSSADFNNQSPIWFYLPVILIGFFPWSIFLLQSLRDLFYRLRQGKVTNAIDLFFAIWLFTIIAFFSIPHSKIITYILPIFPALALLTAKTINSYWDKNSKLATLQFAIISFILISALVMFVENKSDWNQIRLYLYMIATILIAANILMLLFLTKKLKHLFVVYAMTSVAILFTLILSAPTLNTNTAKPLTKKLQTMLKPDDEIVNYYKFYQDVPIYLQQRVTIVSDWDNPDIAFRDNWQRELWYGMQKQNTHEWLINENTFWQRWHGKKRIFVFVNTNYFDQFKNHARKYFFVDKHNDILVFSNRPVVLKILS